MDQEPSRQVVPQGDLSGGSASESYSGRTSRSALLADRSRRPATMLPMGRAAKAFLEPLDRQWKRHAAGTVWLRSAENINQFVWEHRAVWKSRLD